GSQLASRAEGALHHVHAPLLAEGRSGQRQMEGTAPHSRAMTDLSGDAPVLAEDGAAVDPAARQRSLAAASGKARQLKSGTRGPSDHASSRAEAKLATAVR